MYQSRSRGFTLIELLVVIAIIGILSSVVLASLSTARNKANDGKIQTQLKSLQTAAEVYYSTNGNYGAANTSDCKTAGMGADTNSGFKNLVTAANYPDSVAPTCLTDATVSLAGTAYAAHHALLGETGKSWCVDSTGASRKIATPSGTFTVCPAS